jgi:hypothetical protein
MIRILKVLLDLIGAGFYFWICFHPPKAPLKWYVRLSASVLGVY